MALSENFEILGTKCYREYYLPAVSYPLKRWAVAHLIFFSADQLLDHGHF